MAEHKRQHYVPRSYLANFSPDGGKSIGIFNLGQSKVIPSGGLYTQCYEDYFYGKDLKLEKALATGIEGPNSAVLNEIIEDGKLPGPKTEEYANLLVFMIIQSARTLSSSKEGEELVKEFGDRYFKKMALASGKFSPEELKDVELKMDCPVNMSIQQSVAMLPLVLDLKAKLLVNRTLYKFITSDNPVAKTNQYLLGVFDGGVAGWATTGLQVFIPISPELIVTFYDGSIYKVGNRKQEVVNVSSQSDVKALNTLQILNAHQNVYFKNAAQGDEVLSLFGCCSRLRAKEKTATRIVQAVDETGALGELQHTHKLNLDFREPLSFCKIQTSKRIPREQRELSVRQPDLVAVHRMFREKISVGEYTEAEWPGYLKDMIEGGRTQNPDKKIHA
jgi:hypothetical protein